MAAWGERTGQKKTDYAQAYVDKTGRSADLRWDNPDLELLYEYCKDDVAALVATYGMVNKMLEKEQFSEQCIKLEHDVAIIIQRQKEHGFRLDIKKAQGLLAMLQGKMVDIENELQVVFPPYVESGRKNKRTGAPLKDIVTPFNAGSRQQIAERLEKLGVKFTKKTEKGAVIVDETVLASIALQRQGSCLNTSCCKSVWLRLVAGLRR